MSDESLAKAICDETERRKEWSKDLGLITDMWLSGHYTQEEYNCKVHKLFQRKS